MGFGERMRWVGMVANGMGGDGGGLGRWGCGAWCR